MKVEYKCNLFKGDLEGLSYFLGYVCADGSYSEGKHSLWWGSIDEQIVRDITSRLGYIRLCSRQDMPSGNGPIHYNILFGDHVDYFLSLGFVGNKDEQSLDSLPPWVDVFDFVRGFLDGDGSIVLREGKHRTIMDRVSLLGRSTMLTSIQRVIGGKLHEVKLRGSRSKQLYTLDFAGLLLTG